jgi:hypothetical protein
MGDGCCLGYLVDADFLASRNDSLDDLVRPVGAVAEQAEVTKGFLGATQLAFALAKQIRKFDDESSIAVSLVLRQCQDTRHVVVFGRFFLLGEVRY